MTTVRVKLGPDEQLLLETLASYHGCWGRQTLASALGGCPGAGRRQLIACANLEQLGLAERDEAWRGCWRATEEGARLIRDAKAGQA